MKKLHVITHWLTPLLTTMAPTKKRGKKAQKKQVADEKATNSSSGDNDIQFLGRHSPQPTEAHLSAVALRTTGVGSSEQNLPSHQIHRTETYMVEDLDANQALAVPGMESKLSNCWKLTWFK